MDRGRTGERERDWHLTGGDGPRSQREAEGEKQKKGGGMTKLRGRWRLFPCALSLGRQTADLNYREKVMEIKQREREYKEMPSDFFLLFLSPRYLILNIYTKHFSKLQ